jgi:hypothetical protein
MVKQLGARERRNSFKTFKPFNRYAPFKPFNITGADF